MGIKSSNNLTKMLISGLILVGGAGFMWLGWALNGYSVLGIDDANIFFVYAENACKGRGLTYGMQGEWVEGFSSPLWMGICVLVQFVFGRVEWVHIVNITGFFGALGYCICISRRLQTDKNRDLMPSMVPAILLMCFPSFVIWFGLTGMDIGIWIFLLLGFVYELMGKGVEVHPGRMILWMGLLTLTRSESLLVVPALVAGQVLFSSEGNMCSAIKKWLVPVLVWLGGVIVVFLIRHQVYGVWFPNTYYAKVPADLGYRFGEGFRYLETFLRLQPFAVILVSLSVGRLVYWGLAYLRNSQPARFLANRSFIAFVSLLLLLVPVISGGDHFAMHRLMQPALPFLIINAWLLVQEGLNRLMISRFQMHAASILIAVLLIFPYPGWAKMFWFQSSPLRMEFDLARAHYHSGELLSAVLKPVDTLPTLGVVLAGAVARTYEGPVIDLMGLNHAAIGQAPGDRKGVRNHAAFRTEYLETEGVEIFLANPRHMFMQHVLKGVFFQPGFIRDWRYGILFDPDTGLETTAAFFRRDLLQHLVENEQISFRDTLIYRGRSWEPLLPESQNEPD